MLHSPRIRIWSVVGSSCVVLTAIGCGGGDDAPAARGPGMSSVAGSAGVDLSGGAAPPPGVAGTMGAHAGHGGSMGAHAGTMGAHGGAMGGHAGTLAPPQSAHASAGTMGAHVGTPLAPPPSAAHSSAAGTMGAHVGTLAPPTAAHSPPSSAMPPALAGSALAAHGGAADPAAGTQGALAAHGVAGQQALSGPMENGLAPSGAHGTQGGNLNGADAAALAGAAGAGVPGSGQVSTFPKGSAEEVVQRVALAAASGVYDGVDEAISERSRGLLAEMRDLTIDEEKTEQLKKQFAQVRLMNMKNAPNGKTVVLQNGDGETITFTVVRDKGEETYRVKELAIRAARKR